ncbi:MAG: cold shock and DUF1294 domain-containing protein [Gammaproteobacteria bacterium]|nr:cold shock and DUF1294 domain-containing protein [Gammaproteobacteria bacterium]
MQTKGKIASWNHDKGFGFITPNDGGKRVFVHITALSSRQKKPKINQPVSYNTSKDKQGRPCAINVSRADDDPAQSKNIKKDSNTIVGAALFLIIVCISTLMAKTPFLVLPLYLLASMLTFVVYAKDKSAAKRGAWRTPESTLHFLALACGWPGALVAQEKLRHKSKKQPFRLIFWLTVMINIGIFFWLHTPVGAATLSIGLNKI